MRPRAVHGCLLGETVALIDEQALRSESVMALDCYLDAGLAYGRQRLVPERVRVSASRSSGEVLTPSLFD